jgi:hypothetical protein
MAKLSLRKYAATIGVSHTAVAKAINPKPPLGKFSNDGH